MAGNEVRIVVTAQDHASAVIGGISAKSVALGVTFGTMAADMSRSAARAARDVAMLGVNFNAMKEQAQVAFTTMLGDGAKARSFLGELQAFAAKTPFEFPELVRASQRLKAMGFEGEQLLPVMRDIGDAVAGLGGGPEVIDRVVIAFGQIQSKGRAMSQEMLQLTEAGIPAWRFLAEAIGTSIPEAMDLVEDRAIDAATTIAAVRAGMEREFGGMMAQQATTWNGLISTVKDNARILAGELTAGVFVTLKSHLVDFMSWYEANKGEVLRIGKETIESVIAWVSAFATGAREVMGWLSQLHGFLSQSRAGILVEIGLIGAAFTLAFGPAGVILVAAGGLLVALGLWEGDWRDFFSKLPDPVLAAAEDILTIMQSVVQGIDDTMRAMGPFFAAGAAVRGEFGLARDILTGEAQTTFNGAAQSIARRRAEIRDQRDQNAVDRWAVPGRPDPWALPMPGASDAKSPIDIIKDFSSQVGSSAKGAKELTEAEKALDESRREMARTIEQIQKSLLDDQIKAYQEGGFGQLEAIRATQATMMDEVRTKAGELQQIWGLEFPDALSRAFDIVKTGIDAITESARKLQDAGISYINSLNSQGVKRYAPGVFETIAGSFGLNSSFGGGGGVPGSDAVNAALDAFRAGAAAANANLVAGIGAPALDVQVP